MIWVAIDQYVGKSGDRTLNGLVVGGGTSLHNVGNGSGWRLRDDVHEWLVDQDPTYQFCWNDPRRGWWSVGVRDSQLAMMLRLTWS